MPESNGKLSQSELEIIQTWLRLKDKHPSCPVCDSNNWIIGDYLVTSSAFRPDTPTIVGGIVYPQFFVTCNVCMYTRNFMANPVLKLFTEEEASRAEKQETGKKSDSQKKKTAEASNG